MLPHPFAPGRRSAAAALACALTASGLQRDIVAQRPEVPAEVTAVLARSPGANGDDTPMLQAGRVVVRTEVNPDALEAVVVAAVQIHTGLERTIAYFRQLLSYVDGQTTLQYGALPTPVADGDLNALTLDAPDLADLKACTPEHCEMRVGTVDAKTIQSAVDWTASDAPQRGAVWLRSMLVAALRDYQRSGDGALRGFDERGTPLNLQELWRTLEERSVIPAALAPEFQRYLGRYPGARPEPASNEFYFDKQHFTGLKPVTGITHLVTWRDPAQPHRVLVAQKQIQATHYFYGSLAVTLFVQNAAATPSTFVVYTNTIRGDLLRGTQSAPQSGLRGRVGTTVQRRLGEQMVRQSAQNLLTAMKEQLER